MGIFSVIKNRLNSSYLIEWQNKLLAEPSNRLIMNANRLKSVTEQQIQNDIRIILDSEKIITTSKNAETFFTRLNLMEEKMKHAASLEEYISFNSLKPSEALKQFYLEKDEIIMEFLKRYYIALLEKTDSLKTEKAKINQCRKFREALIPFHGQLKSNHLQYIQPKLNLYHD